MSSTDLSSAASLSITPLMALSSCPVTSARMYFTSRASIRPKYARRTSMRVCCRTFSMSHSETRTLAVADSFASVILPKVYSGKVPLMSKVKNGPSCCEKKLVPSAVDGVEEYTLVPLMVGMMPTVELALQFQNGVHLASSSWPWT